MRGLLLLWLEYFLKGREHVTWFIHIQAPGYNQRTALRVKKGCKELGHNCESKGSKCKIDKQVFIAN